MPDASERIAELQREVASNPASRQFYQLGELLRRDGRADEAVSVLRTGLVHHPRYVAAWVSLGRALIEMTEAVAAAKVLQRAIELDTQNPVAWRLLGEARLMQGNRLGALSAMQKSLELAPGDEMVTAAVEALAGETLPPGSFADLPRGRTVTAPVTPPLAEGATPPVVATVIAAAPVPAEAAGPAAVVLPEAVPVAAAAVGGIETASEEPVVEAPALEQAAFSLPAVPAVALSAVPESLEDPFSLAEPPSAAAFDDVFAVTAPVAVEEVVPLAAATTPLFEPAPSFFEELPAPGPEAVAEAAEAPVATEVQEPAPAAAFGTESLGEPVAETVLEAAFGTESISEPVAEAVPEPEEAAPAEVVEVAAEEPPEAVPAPAAVVETPAYAAVVAEPVGDVVAEPEAPPAARPAAGRSGEPLHIARPTVTLARLCIQQEDYPTAVAILERVTDEQPANQEARDLLDLVNDMLEVGAGDELPPLSLRERKVAALQRWLASLTLGRERWLP